MQITEQIIQRIARQVFNQMFPSSLRQSGAVISGAGSSVQYAVEAGHAASADNATYATSAGSVTWSGISGKPASKTAWGQSYLNASSEFQTITGDMSNVGNISFAATGKNIGGLIYFDTTNDRVGIGTSSPQYALHVVGTIYATNGVTDLSDINKKDIIDYNAEISTAKIASAPLIHYTLKGDTSKQPHVGSIAQYWQKVLPEAVLTSEDGCLSMKYGLIAFSAAVSNARTIMRLNAKIIHLSKEIEILKNQINNEQ